LYCWLTVSLVQLGPKADEILSEKLPFVLKIRSTKKGAGSNLKSKRVATPVSTISIRRKRTRVEAADDPVEPFSPHESELVFDDIEPELEIREPTPPLVQARKLRATPSVPVAEGAKKQGLDANLDANQECYQNLCAVRENVCCLCLQPLRSY